MAKNPNFSSKIVSDTLDKLNENDSQFQSLTYREKAKFKRMLIALNRVRDSYVDTPGYPYPIHPGMCMTRQGILY